MPSRVLKNVLRKLIYGTWGSAPSDRFQKVRYQRIWVSAVFITASVSILPLLVLTGFNFSQYQRALKEESTHPIHLLVSTSKRSLEYSIEERRNALLYIAKTNPIDELRDKKRLKIIKTNLDETFAHFVDIGLIDSNANLISYVGPPELEKKLSGVNYSREEWFSEVLSGGIYVSGVFKGHRGKPHFVIAVRTSDDLGDIYILRATLDMQLLTSQVPAFGHDEVSDVFIIDRDGILQTRSRSGASELEKSPVGAPPYSDSAEVSEIMGKSGVRFIMGYAYIANTPFIFVMTRPMPDLMKNWLILRRNLLAFLFTSILVIIVLTMTVSSVLVSRIREADLKHEAALHHVEYAAKMASIGRLAAGVAHEINNPLAIINEKAGLLHDMISMNEDFPSREKSIKIIESILNSVERGSTITHRLLGFARHLDIQITTIDLAALINEVLGFLEKEATFRNIEVQTFFQEDLPTVKSDKGQLQQVFLNIINNAFEAVKKDGRVGILVERKDHDVISIQITDTGPGIAEEDMDRIFEPFFTTKSEGTGLGLSITYGIIRKLKGDIKVESKLGQGTSFVITIPVEKKL